jgi:cytoskeletal protein RodZ
MRIATLLGIAVLGMSGAAIASVGTAPQDTPQTTAPSAQDNSATTDNSMTPPSGGTTAPSDSTGDSSGG